MKINKIILHCSATPNGRETSAKDIHQWHLSRGWSGIGYHYVIKTNGMIETGRPEYWQGAHARGHNSGSIGICLIGTDSYSNGQYYTLERLIKNIIHVHDLTHDDVIGHNEVSAKTCPGFNVKEWVKGTFN